MLRNEKRTRKFFEKGEGGMGGAEKTILQKCFFRSPHVPITLILLPM
jgi:hypothetical protein